MAVVAESLPAETAVAPVVTDAETVAGTVEKADAPRESDDGPAAWDEKRLKLERDRVTRLFSKLDSRQKKFNVRLERSKTTDAQTAAIQAHVQGLKQKILTGDKEQALRALGDFMEMDPLKAVETVNLAMLGRPKASEASDEKYAKLAAEIDGLKKALAGKNETEQAQRSAAVEREWATNFMSSLPPDSLTARIGTEYRAEIEAKAKAIFIAAYNKIDPETQEPCKKVLDNAVISLILESDYRKRAALLRGVSEVAEPGSDGNQDLPSHKPVTTLSTSTSRAAVGVGSGPATKRAKTQTEIDAEIDDGLFGLLSHVT
jgi:hypothetical protein